MSGMNSWVKCCACVIHIIYCIHMSQCGVLGESHGRGSVARTFTAGRVAWPCII